jgi:hypothetical protein
MKRFYRGMMQGEAAPGGGAQGRADRDDEEKALAIALRLGSVRASGGMEISQRPKMLNA